MNFYYDETENTLYFHGAKQGHKIADKYYPSKEEIEAEWQKDGNRIQIITVHIQHMTGKLVHEK